MFGNSFITITALFVFLLPYILLLGIFGHWDALAVGFEFMLDDLSVSTVLHTECVVQHPSDVIFPVQHTHVGISTQCVRVTNISRHALYTLTV